MIWRYWKYNWLDLSDEIWMQTRFMMQSSQYTAPVRISTTANSNDFGGRLSKALTDWRLFNFSGVVFDDSRYWRGAAYERIYNKIMVESDPSKNQFYDLTWIDDLDKPKTVKAAVYSEPIATNWIWQNYTNLEFSLYSTSPRIYNPTVEVCEWWTWFFWWVAYPYSLGDPWWGCGFPVVCINNGNWAAPVRIEVFWDCEDIKIFNVSNLSYALRMEWEFKDFVYDNTENVSIESNGKISQIITDQGADVSRKRQSWQWILLEPWANNIVVTVKSWTPTVKITFRDTFKLP